MLLGALGASLLWNLLILRAGYRFKLFLILTHPLAKFEIQKYYQNEPRFNGSYSRDSFPKRLKDGAYVINLDEYTDVRADSIALYVWNIEMIYFDSFGVAHVNEEIKKIIGNKNIKIKNI